MATRRRKSAKDILDQYNRMAEDAVENYNSNNPWLKRAQAIAKRYIHNINNSKVYRKEYQRAIERGEMPGRVVDRAFETKRSYSARAGNEG